MSVRLRRLFQRITLWATGAVTAAILFLMLGGDRLFRYEIPSDGFERLESGEYGRLPRYRWVERPSPFAAPAGIQGPTVDPRNGDWYFSQPSEAAGYELCRARRQGAGFLEPEVLFELSTNFDEVDPCFDGEGRALWFASNRPGLGGFDLYRAERRGDGFAAPTRLALSSESDDRHPALSDAAEVVVFASARLSEDGVRSDLYLARAEDGRFDQAIPLLSLSEVRADQRSPAFLPGGHALVFATDREPSRGGFDLWISRIAAGEFQPPAPFREFNSDQDDLDPFVASEGRFLGLVRGHLGATTTLAFAERREVYLLDVTGANTWSKLLKPLLAALLGLLISYLALAWDRLHPFVKFIILSLIVHLLVLLFVKPKPVVLPPGGGDLEAIAVAWLGGESEATGQEQARGDQVESARAVVAHATAKPTPMPTESQAAAEAVPERAVPTPTAPAARDLAADSSEAPAMPKVAPVESAQRNEIADAVIAPRSDSGSAAQTEVARAASISTLAVSGERSAPAMSDSPATASLPERSTEGAVAPTPSDLAASRSTPAAPAPESGGGVVGVARSTASDLGIPKVVAGPSSVALPNGSRSLTGPHRPSSAAGTPSPSQASAEVPSRESPATGVPVAPAIGELAAARPSPGKTPAPRADGGATASPSSLARSTSAEPQLASSVEGPRSLAAERPSSVRLTRQGSESVRASERASGIQVPERSVDVGSVAVAPTASVYSQRSGPGKLEAVQRGGGSAETEAAVLAGLRYLQSKQRKSGAFGPRTSHGKYGDFRIGKSGLALLAFLGAGATHSNRGEFQTTVKGALDFLVGAQNRRTGHIGDGEAYGHGIATYALAEAFAMTKDEALRGPLEAAVARILRAQIASGRQKLRGGWSYFYADEDREYDPWPRLSISAWQIMALESARLSGIEVPEESLAAAKRYVVSCYDEEMQAFRYNHDPQWLRGAYPTLPGSNGAALFALQILGVKRDDPMVEAAREYVEARRPADRWRRYSDGEFAMQGLNNLYYVYYATLGMFVLGGEPWDAWNREMSALLVQGQSRDGSWKPVDYYAEFSGDTDQERLYTTAFAVLTLEVYYRYVTPLLMQAAAPR